VTPPLKGHVKLARKLFAADGGDPLWLEQREFSRWEAWVDVIQLAAWKPWRYVTQHGPIDLQRGEFVASLRYLADRWTWTVKKVRTWLATLEKWARLRAQQETQAGTVYLIVNYERYQSTDDETGTPKGTPEGTAGAQRGHKREAVKQLDGESIKAVQSSAAVASVASVAVVHSWTAEGTACWLELVGRMTPGRFGKALKPFVDKHGWPVVRATMVRWIIERNATGKGVKLEWFADECAAQIALPPQDILDEYGGLTQYGKRLVAGVK
jgi:hypothetical protein